MALVESVFREVKKMGKKLRSLTPCRDKLEKPVEPAVVDIPPKMAARFGPGRMLIPTPLLVDALIHKVQKGRLVTVRQIRERLAGDFKADVTCPLTTGIFIRIAAEAAEEDLRMGREEITPYWRVVRDDGSLNEKFPGGVEAQAARLKEEGYTIEPGKGKKPPKVKDFEKHLAGLLG
ncbi:MAG: MGMT family protein [Peptococcaceae bacterium]|nr:MAG: MGMT family protein [Peptococcaceae bacterium]